MPTSSTGVAWPAISRSRELARPRFMSDQTPKRRFPATVPLGGTSVTAPKSTWRSTVSSPGAAQRSMRTEATSQRPSGERATGLGLDSQAVRTAMVQKLRQQPEMHEAVLSAMAKVPRHVFVETALVNQAYADTSLPIGWGQTISKPSVVARMLSLLPFDAHGRVGKVLEIGTGCGYQAAVLAQVSRHVVTVERVEGLYKAARAHLAQANIGNVQTVFGDGMRGHGPSAPFQAIVAAAGGEQVPQAWLDQLAVGGRLIAPCANARGGQTLLVIDRNEHGFHRTELEAVLFVPLKSGLVQG